MVQARTCSGKTGAIVLPILERVDIRKKTCSALVLANELKQIGRSICEENHE
jgi:ATP-dependent RNA helicase DeaD